MAAINKALEKYSAEHPVFYEDEVDIHLNPKIGADWQLRGQQKRVVTPGQNEKYYLAGALHSCAGKVSYVGSNSKSSVLFIALMKHLKATYRRAKTVTLIVDTVTSWNHISSYGDQYQSFEIRPQKGMDDPAYRLFAVIGRGSRYYLIAHRGSRSCNALDSDHCINYESDQPRMVRQQDYRKMLISAVKGNAGTFARILDPYVFN